MTSGVVVDGNPQGIRTVFQLFFGLLPIVAIGSQLIIHLRLGYPVLNFLSYFTNLANLFAAVTLLAGAWISLRAGASANYKILRAMSAICMVVVGVVFAVLLRDVDLGSLQPWVNFTLHYLMPCAIVADWLLWPPRTSMGFRDLLLCQLPPAIYLAYTLVRGASTGWYPYPFLNPAVVGGYGLVAMYVVGITGVFFLSGLTLFWIAKRRVRQQGR